MTLRNEYFKPLREAAMWLLSESERLEDEAHKLKTEASELRMHWGIVMMAYERLSEGDPLRGVPKD